MSIEQRKGFGPLSRALGRSLKKATSSTVELKQKPHSFLSSMEEEALKAECPPCIRKWRRIRNRLYRGSQLPHSRVRVD